MPSTGATNPAEVRIFAVDGTSLRVYRNGDANALGITFIANTSRIGFNDVGDAAFLGGGNNSGGVFAGNGTNLRRVIDLSAPGTCVVANASVAFNDAGLAATVKCDLVTNGHSIAVGDGGAPVRGPAEGDPIATTNGTVLIRNIRTPSLSLAANGDLAFTATFTDAQQTDRGSGLVIARVDGLFRSAFE